MLLSMHPVKGMEVRTRDASVGVGAKDRATGAWPVMFFLRRGAYCRADIVGKCEWCGVIGTLRELFVAARDNVSMGCRWCHLPPPVKCRSTRVYLSHLRVLSEGAASRPHPRAEGGVARMIPQLVLAAVCLSIERILVARCHCSNGKLGQSLPLDFCKVHNACAASAKTATERRAGWKLVVKTLQNVTPIPTAVIVQTVLPFLLLWGESYVTRK